MMRKLCAVAGFLLLVGLLNLHPAKVAAALPWQQSRGQPGAGAEVDPQLWAQIAASPDAPVTFVVEMQLAQGEPPQAAAESQLSLESILQILQPLGSISQYRICLGANAILVEGSPSAVRYLARLPGVAALHLSQSLACGEGFDPPLGAEALTATGHITGTITGPDGTTPLAGIRVTAYRQTGPTSWTIDIGPLYPGNPATTNASGAYDIPSRPTGIYRVKFEDPAGNYIREYYDNKFDFNLATNFNVTDGQTTPNINASLALGGRISGTVTQVSNGSPVVDIVVSAYQNTGGVLTFLSSDISASNGSYIIEAIPPGSVVVHFSDPYDPPRYLDEYYDNVLDLNHATLVNVIAGITTSGINASLGSYGSLSGNVSAQGSSLKLKDIQIDVWQFNSGTSSWDSVSYDLSDASGNYSAGGLDTDDYRIQFHDTKSQFADEYYNKKPDIDSANNVHVELGFNTPSINAQLELKQDTVSNSLVTGWNLISLPVTLSNTAPASAFTSLSPNYTDVYAYNACDVSDPWKLFNPNVPPPVNDLAAVGVTQGYWINITAPDTLTLTGTHPLTTTVSLCAGWNLVGFPSVTKQAVATALASISGKYSLVYQYKASDLADPWKSYNPAAPNAGDLKEMEAGYGYWIKMKQAATLTIKGR